MECVFQLNPLVKDGYRPAVPVIFIPGWGFDGSIIELAEKVLPWMYPAGMVDPYAVVGDLHGFLEGKGIARIDLAGWSMGANLALDFFRAYPDKVRDLYLISMRRGWPDDEIERIRSEFVSHPAAFLASFYRKCFVGYRRAYDRFLIRFQEHYFHDIGKIVGILEKGLDYLKQPLARDMPVFDQSGSGVYLIHGRKDIIAPVDQIPEFTGANLKIQDHAGHLPFLSSGFILPWDSRKRIVRNRFSRAAGTYDCYSKVQQEVACRLADRLDPEQQAGSILEIGCGTGRFTIFLARKFPGSRVLALDFSPAMIEVAGRKLSSHNNIQFLCSDAEIFLACRRDPFDLIASNSTIQWFESIDAAFLRISRLLNENGVFIGSIFGPETLKELKLGLTFVAGREITALPERFPSECQLRDLITACFSSVEIEELRITQAYDSLKELLTSISKTGAAGWRDPSQPLLTRGRLKKLDKWFVEYNKGYRVTYQVFIIRGAK